MASIWNPIVAQQSLGESTLWTNVLPVKGNYTHRWLRTSARIVIQRVADTVRYRAGEFKQFCTAFLLRGANFPSERANLGLSCYGEQGGFNGNL